MDDRAKTKAQLIAELARLRERVAGLEGQQDAEQLAVHAALRTKISQALTRREGLPYILQSCAEAIVEHLNAAFTRIWTLNQAQGMLELQASAGRYTSLHGSYSRIPLGDFKIGRIAASGQPYLSNNVQHDPEIGNRAWARREGMVAFAGYPLRVEGRTVGVMALFSQHPLDVAVLDALSGIADAIAQGIERRRAEEALSASEARFRAIVDQAAVGIVQTDLQGRFVLINQGFCELLGYQPEELLGRRFQDITHPDDVEQSKRQFAQLARSQRFFSLEKRYLCKDGSIVWGVVTVSVVRDEQGEPRYAVAIMQDITDRRRAEEQIQRLNSDLQHRVSELQTLLDVMPIGISIAHDPSCAYITANPYMAELLGIRPDQNSSLSSPEASQLPFTFLRHGRALSAEELPIQVAARLGIHVQGAELDVLRRDGKLRHLLASAAPVFDEQGHVRSCFGAFVDITERKEAEQAQRFLGDASSVLSSSLDYQTTLQRVARLAVPNFADWCFVDLWSADGSFQRVAVAHRQREQEALGYALMPRYASRPQAPHGIEKVARTGEPDLIRDVPDSLLASVARDQEHLEMLRALNMHDYICVPLMARGRTLGTLTFIAAESGRRYSERDLALAEELARRAALAIDNARLYQEAQQAGEQARRAAQRLELLADASRALMTTQLDAQLILTSSARYIVEALGDLCLIRLLSADGAQLQPEVLYHADPLLCEQAQRRLAAMPGASWEEPAAQVLQTGQGLLLPSLAPAQVHAGGQPELANTVAQLPIYSLLVVPLRAQSRVLGTLELARTSAGRSYSPDDLLLLQDLADRTASALENARLYAQAQRALRVRDQFLGLAAHELRTPMTAILGNAQLLQRRILREPQASERDQRTAQNMVDQVRRLHRLSNSLLDLSRIQEGRLTIERQELNLSALLRQLVEEIQPMLQQHRLTLRGLDQPSPISGDQLRLEQVFQNLLQNALKYSPEGGAIDLCLEQNEREIRVTISDQGIGIPARELPLIFERFYRASNVAADQLSGMGIGLYIVQEIVSLHGGVVEVHSQEGQGTRFSVTLPRADIES